MARSTRPGGPSQRQRQAATSRPHGGGRSTSKRGGGRAPSSRPASRPVRREPRRASGTTSQRPRSLRRLVILGVLVTFLAVILAPTLRAYVNQRGEISALEQQIAQQKSTVADLTKERQQWKDPAYVEQQARERLKFVKPGDKQYTTLTGDEPAESTSPESGIAAVPDTVQVTRPWYGEVWESMVIADSGTLSPAADEPASTTPEPPPVSDSKSGK